MRSLRKFHIFFQVNIFLRPFRYHNNNCKKGTQRREFRDITIFENRLFYDIFKRALSRGIVSSSYINYKLLEQYVKPDILSIFYIYSTSCFFTVQFLHALYLLLFVIDKIVIEVWTWRSCGVFKNAIVTRQRK